MSKQPAASPTIETTTALPLVPLGTPQCEQALATLSVGDPRRLLALTEKIWLAVDKRKEVRAGIVAAQQRANDLSADARAIDLLLAALTQERDGIEHGHQSAKAG